jgi:hypothetical protein
MSAGWAAVGIILLRELTREYILADQTFWFVVRPFALRPESPRWGLRMKCVAGVRDLLLAPMEGNNGGSEDPGMAVTAMSVASNNMVTK